MKTIVQSSILNMALYSLAYVISMNFSIPADEKKRVLKNGAFFCCVALAAQIVLKPVLWAHCLFGFLVILAVLFIYRLPLNKSCIATVSSYTNVMLSGVLAQIVGYAMRTDADITRVLLWPQYIDQSIAIIAFVSIFGLIFKIWRGYFKNRTQEIRTKSVLMSMANLTVLVCSLASANLFLRFLTAYGFEISTIPGLMHLLISGYMLLFMMSLGMLFLLNLSIISHRHLHVVKETAVRDLQTGVLNRQAGLDALSKRIMECKKSNLPLTICFVDINNLKQVNDRFGHAVGDSLIELISETLRNSLRDVDFVCRLGGDEFLIAFCDCNLTQAKGAWGRIYNQITQINENPAINFPVSVSYGFSEYNPIESLSVKDFIEQADAEMYVNKNKYKKIKGMKRNGTSESKEETGLE